MNIYNNKFATYNNLMTLAIAIYATTANLTGGTSKTVIMLTALIGWIIFLDKSKREYYNLLDYVAKKTR